MKPPGIAFGKVELPTSLPDFASFAHTLIAPATVVPKTRSSGAVEPAKLSTVGTLARRFADCASVPVGAARRPPRTASWTSLWARSIAW